MDVEGAQLVLGKGPLQLGPLDGAIVEALTILDDIDHVVAVQGEIDSLAHPDVVEGRSQDLHVDDGIEEGGELVDDEATVVHELLGIRLGEDGAVDVVLAGAEGGQEGRALLDDDELDLVQPGSGVEEEVGVPLEDDAFGAAKLVHDEWAAAEGHLAEASLVRIDNLGGNDGPGGVGHVLDGRDKGAGEGDVEGVRIRRLQFSTVFRQEALRVAPVGGGNGRAAADEALVAVRGG